MHRDIDFVRKQYPLAEAAVQGGTTEVCITDVGHERWVILTENSSGAQFLGEGQSITAAWADAAKNLRLLAK